MAQKGRKPKPTALKVLEGNPGKRPLNLYEPSPEGEMPEWRATADTFIVLRSW